MLDATADPIRDTGDLTDSDIETIRDALAHASADTVCEDCPGDCGVSRRFGCRTMLWRAMLTRLPDPDSKEETDGN